MLDLQLSGKKPAENEDMQGLAYLLSVILDSVNYLHPFREGNGRTQREFIRLLALEKGYLINLNPPDNPNIFERYMNGKDLNHRE